MTKSPQAADITVVITNYNYGRYLREAVDSALGQQGPRPHVIVVDDGSTDADTEQVLADLPPEVEVVRQGNAGLSEARNAGLHRASTPYLIVLDADDRLRPDALATLRVPLDRDPKLGFTYGITHFFGDWEGEMTMPPYDPFKLLYRHMIGSTCLFRRELLADVGGFDPSFKGYEDWEFWLHALSCGWRGQRVEHVTFEYRRHGATMISGARRNYHYWYRRLRAKHAALYRQSRELARRTHASPLDRVVYPLFWGRRPVPAFVEHLLYSRRWRSRS